MSPSAPGLRIDNQKNPWAKRGWLLDGAYYSFWGNILSRDLRDLLHGRVVADIGSGNARVWEPALRGGLRPAQLTLIDPDLGIAPSLAALDFVTPLKEGLADAAPVTADTALFKQSFHLVHRAVGPALFDMVRSPVYINFSMPHRIDWPVSEVFLELFRPSHLDVRQEAARAGKSVIAAKVYDYPVRITRDEWIAMIENRFVSCLKDCSEETLALETGWAMMNLPETLEFSDRVECIVFGD